MSTPPAKLRGKLPDATMCGLLETPVVHDLLAKPTAAVYVIGVVINGKTEVNNLTGTNTPVVEFVHMEVVDDTGAPQVAAMLDRLHETRTGEMMLPFERGEVIPAPGSEPADEGD